MGKWLRSEAARLTRPSRTMAGEVCIPNIGPRERDKRLKFGVVLFALSLLAAFALIALDVTRPVRIALFVPFWLGAVGIFQAREKT